MSKRISPEARRAQILETAVSVVLSKGLLQAKTRDVTEALGVSTGLLFRYFPNWAELRAAAFALAAERDLDHLFSGFGTQDLEEDIASFVTETLPDGNTAHWELWLDAGHAARHDALIAEVQIALTDTWHGRISAALEMAVAARRIPPLDSDASAWRIMAMLDGLADHVLMPGARLSPETARRLLLEFIRREIGLTAL